MQPTSIFAIIILFWLAFVGIGWAMSEKNDERMEAFDQKCVAAGGTVLKGYVGSRNAFGCFKVDELKIQF